MRLASILSSSELDQPNVRRRATSLLLTILAHLLLLVLLIKLAPPYFESSKPKGSLVTVSIPDAQEETTQTKTPQKARQETAKASPAPVAPPPPPIKLPTTAAPWVLTPGLERFDVRQLPPSRAQAPQSDASATDMADDGPQGDSSDRPVAYGSAGQPLYPVQWYGDPPGDAQLSMYIKRYARPMPGYGIIACRTVARFHVDDCEAVGETPGSGYARVMLESAWQYLVMPPRVGGKKLIGGWVYIRIDFSQAPDPRSR